MASSVARPCHATLSGTQHTACCHPLRPHLVPLLQFVPKDPSDPTKLAKYNVTLVAKFKKLGEPIYATW